MEVKRVFISYSHDSVEHQGNVAELVGRLVAAGIPCRFDQQVQGTPDEGWPDWTEAQVVEADKVIAICTQRYHLTFDGRNDERQLYEEGRGVRWEGKLIKQRLYDRKDPVGKYIPVLLASAEPGDIPDCLAPSSHYRLMDEFDALVAHLKGKPPPAHCAMPSRPFSVRRIGTIVIPAALLAMLVYVFLFSGTAPTGERTHSLPAFLQAPENAWEWDAFGTRYLQHEGRNGSNQPFRAAYDALDAFVDREEKLLWWWINGPPGAGKTPLVHSWIEFLEARGRATGDPIAAGLLGESSIPVWASWQPDLPTVIVVDDANESIEEILNLFRGFCARKVEDLAHEVRILLVDRSVPESLVVLQEERNTNVYLHSIYPLVPPAFRIEHLRALAGMFEKDGGPLVLSDAEERRLLHISTGQPLIMVLGLDSLAKYGALDWELHRALFKKESGTYLNKLEQYGVSKQCLDLLVLASATGGVTWRQLHGLGSDVAQSCSKRTLDKVLGTDTVNGVPPITPSVFGGFFLLEQYGEMTDPERESFVHSITSLAPITSAITLLILATDYPSSAFVEDMMKRNAPKSEYWNRVQAVLRADDPGALEALVDWLAAAALGAQSAGYGPDGDLALVFERTLSELSGRFDTSSQ